jgi:hypothetical protein
MPDDLEPLARRKPDFTLPPAWKLRTFKDRGFLYLWNVSPDQALKNWLGDRPNRIKFPFNVADKETLAEFEKKYGGKDDIPIFSDPRIVPVFHGVGPASLPSIPKARASPRPANALRSGWTPTRSGSGAA